MRLGVNIDHVATVRQARGTFEPDPVQAAFLCERGGADHITIHLREDRRHIQKRDLVILRQVVATGINLEMAATNEMVDIAIKHRPDIVTLVPEKREELTTEGGLNVKKNSTKIGEATARLLAEGIPVSMFIEPDEKQIDASIRCGATAIELHTGAYANAPESGRDQYLEKIAAAAIFANEPQVTVCAGHGLTYYNVHRVAAIPQIVELNIGHSIISRAIFTGIEAAVQDMKTIIRNIRASIK
jgi:pyridoxine 5-phosphate synthase